jgi:hypothetical protein
LQCIEECTADTSAGKCGDQYYLDEWPNLYRNLVISANPGVGLGPWNVEKRSIEMKGSHVFAAGSPAIFYHYQSLQMLKPTYGLKSVWLTGWYDLPKIAVDAIYQPYAAELWLAASAIERKGFLLLHKLSRLPNHYASAVHCQLVLSIGGLYVPVRWNPSPRPTRPLRQTMHIFRPLIMHILRRLIMHILRCLMKTKRRLMKTKDVEGETARRSPS